MGVDNRDHTKPGPSGAAFYIWSWKRNSELSTATGVRNPKIERIAFTSIQIASPLSGRL
jgi:hypothetical protein